MAESTKGGKRLSGRDSLPNIKSGSATIPRSAQNQCRSQSAATVHADAAVAIPASRAPPQPPPWEDREDDPTSTAMMEESTVWPGPPSRMLKPKPEEQQRQDQHDRVPAEPDATLNQTTEKPSYATPAVNDGDQHDGDR